MNGCWVVLTQTPLVLALGWAANTHCVWWPTSRGTDLAVAHTTLHHTFEDLNEKCGLG